MKTFEEFVLGIETDSLDIAWSLSRMDSDQINTLAEEYVKYRIDSFKVKEKQPGEYWGPRDR